MRFPTLVSVTTLSLLAFAAPASASLQTFGSDLTAAADRTEARQADTVYWQQAFADGRLPTAPVQGQIKEVRIKGFAQSDRAAGSLGGGGETMFHVQSLVALQGATTSVKQTSQAFDVPNRLVADANTVTTYRPANFCVEPGEAIAVNTIGGWDGFANRDLRDGPVGLYPDGTPLQIFSAVPEATVTQYTKDEGTNNGAVLHPDKHRGAGSELLMQMTLATGDDRSYECGGPNTYRPADAPRAPRTDSSGSPLPAMDDPARAAATIPAGKRASVDSKGFVSVGLHCPSLKPCQGVVTLTSGKIVLGKRDYAIAKGTSAGIRFRLSEAGLKLVKRKRYKLTAKATAVTQGAGTQVGTVQLKKRGS